MRPIDGSPSRRHHGVLRRALDRRVDRPRAPGAAIEPAALPHLRHALRRDQPGSRARAAPPVARQHDDDCCPNCRTPFADLPLPDDPAVPRCATGSARGWPRVPTSRRRPRASCAAGPSARRGRPAPPRADRRPRAGDPRARGGAAGLGRRHGRRDRDRVLVGLPEPDPALVLPHARRHVEPARVGLVGHRGSRARAGPRRRRPAPGSCAWVRAAPRSGSHQHLPGARPSASTAAARPAGRAGSRARPTPARRCPGRCCRGSRAGRRQQAGLPPPAGRRRPRAAGGVPTSPRPRPGAVARQRHAVRELQAVEEHGGLAVRAAAYKAAGAGERGTSVFHSSTGWTDDWSDA